MNCLANQDRDRFIYVTGTAIPEETRNTLWEYNHTHILGAIDYLTKKLFRFPATTELQQETGLSRTTIHRHLREYYNGPEYKQKQDEFILMRESILAKAYTLAADGDIRAMKIFLEATDDRHRTIKIGNQNNYIQLNNLVITEEELKMLPPESVDQITNIIKEQILTRR